MDEVFKEKQLQKNDKDQCGNGAKINCTNRIKKFQPKLIIDDQSTMYHGSVYGNALREALFTHFEKPYLTPDAPSMIFQDGDNVNKYICRQCRDSYHHSSSLEEHITRGSWILGYWCTYCFRECDHLAGKKLCCSKCTKSQIQKFKALQSRGLKKSDEPGIVKIFFNPCQLLEHMLMHNIEEISMNRLMLLPFPSGIGREYFPHLKMMSEALMDYMFLSNIHIVDWLLNNKIHKWWRMAKGNNPVANIIKKYPFEVQQIKQLLNCNSKVNELSKSKINIQNSIMFQQHRNIKSTSNSRNALSDCTLDSIQCSSNVSEERNNLILPVNLNVVDCGPCGSKHNNIQNGIVLLSKTTRPPPLISNSNTASLRTSRNESSISAPSKAKISVKTFAKIPASPQKNNSANNSDFELSSVREKDNYNTSPRVVTIRSAKPVNLTSLIKSFPQIAHKIANKKIVFIRKNNPKDVLRKNSKVLQNERNQNVNSFRGGKMLHLKDQKRVQVHKVQPSNSVVAKSETMKIGFKVEKIKSSNLNVISDNNRCRLKCFKNLTPDLDKLKRCIPNLININTIEITSCPDTATVLNPSSTSQPQIFPTSIQQKQSSGVDLNSSMDREVSLSKEISGCFFTSLKEDSRNILKNFFHEDEIMHLTVKKNVKSGKSFLSVANNRTTIHVDNHVTFRDKMFFFLNQLNKAKLHQRISHVKTVSRKYSEKVGVYNDEIIERHKEFISTLEDLAENLDSTVQSVCDDYFGPFLNSNHLEKCITCQKVTKPAEYLVGFSCLASDVDYCVCYDFICHKCNTFQGSRERFLTHLQYHEREPPFICPECNVSFSSYRDLNVHMWTKCFHQFVKRFLFCNICEIDGFCSLESIVNHFIIMHSLKMAACSLCCMVFEYKRYCISHMKKGHSEVLNSDPLHLTLCLLDDRIIPVECYYNHVKNHKCIRESLSYVCNLCTDDKKLFKTQELIKKHVYSCHYSELTSIVDLQSLEKILMVEDIKQLIGENSFLNKFDLPSVSSSASLETQNSKSISSSQNLDRLRKLAESDQELVSDDEESKQTSVSGRVHLNCIKNKLKKKTGLISKTVEDNNAFCHSSIIGEHDRTTSPSYEKNYLFPFSESNCSSSNQRNDVHVDNESAAAHTIDSQCGREHVLSYFNKLRDKQICDDTQETYKNISEMMIDIKSTSNQKTIKRFSSSDKDKILSNQDSVENTFVFHNNDSHFQKSTEEQLLAISINELPVMAKSLIGPGNKCNSEGLLKDEVDNVSTLQGLPHSGCNTVGNNLEAMNNMEHVCEGQIIENIEITETYNRLLEGYSDESVEVPKKDIRSEIKETKLTINKVQEQSEENNAPKVLFEKNAEDISSGGVESSSSPTTKQYNEIGGNIELPKTSTKVDRTVYLMEGIDEATDKKNAVDISSVGVEKSGSLTTKQNTGSRGNIELPKTSTKIDAIVYSMNEIDQATNKKNAGAISSEGVKKSSSLTTKHNTEIGNIKLSKTSTKIHETASLIEDIDQVSKKSDVESHGSEFHNSRVSITNLLVLEPEKDIDKIKLNNFGSEGFVVEMERSERILQLPLSSNTKRSVDQKIERNGVLETNQDTAQASTTISNVSNFDKTIGLLVHESANESITDNQVLKNEIDRTVSINYTTKCRSKSKEKQMKKEFDSSFTKLMSKCKDKSHDDEGMEKMKTQKSMISATNEKYPVSGMFKSSSNTTIDSTREQHQILRNNKKKKPLITEHISVQSSPSHMNNSLLEYEEQHSHSHQIREIDLQRNVNDNNILQKPLTLKYNELVPEQQPFDILNAKSVETLNENSPCSRNTTSMAQEDKLNVNNDNTFDCKTICREVKSKMGSKKNLENIIQIDDKKNDVIKKNFLNECRIVMVKNTASTCSKNDTPLLNNANELPHGIFEATNYTLTERITTKSKSGEQVLFLENEKIMNKLFNREVPKKVEKKSCSHKFNDSNINDRNKNKDEMGQNCLEHESCETVILSSRNDALKSNIKTRFDNSKSFESGIIKNEYSKELRPRMMNKLNTEIIKTRKSDTVESIIELKELQVNKIDKPVSKIKETINNSDQQSLGKRKPTIFKSDLSKKLKMNKLVLESLDLKEEDIQSLKMNRDKSVHSKVDSKILMKRNLKRTRSNTVKNNSTAESNKFDLNNFTPQQIPNLRVIKEPASANPVNSTFSGTTLEINAAVKYNIGFCSSHNNQLKICKFKCHLCGDSINTSWSVLRDHYSTKHAHNYKLCFITSRLTYPRYNIDVNNERYTRKRKPEVSSLVITDRKRRWSSKKADKILEATTECKSGLDVQLESLIDSEGYFKCKKCNDRCVNMIELRQHIARYHRITKANYICLECGENFINSHSLQMHLKTFHKIDKPIEYMKQHPTYAPEMIDDAEVDVNSTVANQCHVCMAVFEDQLYVEKHLKVHEMSLLSKKRLKSENSRKNHRKKCMNTKDNLNLMAQERKKSASFNVPKTR